MSLNIGPIHGGAFAQSTQPFTSTVHDYHSIFNVWIVILTAIFFFVVLSWYNVFLSLWSKIARQRELTDKELQDLNGEILVTFIYAIFWTLLGILVYYILDRSEKLGSGDDEAESEHPLLRGEVDALATINSFGA